MSDTSRVEQVVRSAWERRLLVVAVERTAIAVAVVLATLVLMLLVGTQVLDWRWMLILAAVGLGIAGYQVRQQLLGHYRVAQILDRRLQLADSLSTGWYLLTCPGHTPDPITEYQLRGADRAARSVNVAAAFPFTGRRLWSIAGGLALVAASLFGVRYFVTNSLSLRHSLIPFQLSDVFERRDKDSEETKRQREDGTDASQSQKSTQKADGQKDAKDQRANPPPAAQGNAPGAGQNPNDPAEMREAKEGQDSQNKQSADGAAGSAQPKAGDKQGDDGEKTPGSQKPSSDDAANSPKSSNGLIDRMKDALSSLAAKMRPNSQGKQQPNEQKSGEEKSGDQQSASKEQNNASQQAAANREASEQQQASEGQAQGQTQEKSRSGQGRSADQSADKSKSDSHSGIGSQDGDKATKDAEQLKAMGKLAEIIGKRSASATGDVMVENPSGKQRLQTDYSQRVGHHADLGGEINRDEIPLMYQQYIREYMSQVRQQAKRRKPSPASPEEP
jgi:hypothetical protein